MKLMQGKSDNDMWFFFWKGVVTTSMCHSILTKMEKISKAGGGYVNMFQVTPSVFGLRYVSPDLPALKYG